MSQAGPLLGITKLFRWTVGRDLTDAVGTLDEVAVLKVVSIQRLKALAPRLQQITDRPGGGEHHELVRFNLLNLDEKPVTVCAIGLPNVSREMRCDVVPPVILEGGAVYPFMLETRSGFDSELVNIQVECASG